MTTIIWALIALTAFTALIHICYYLFVFSKFAFDRSNTTVVPQNVPVSVIVSAKNDIKNLKLFLPSILNQNYPEFEVIVVNDGSWDGTGEYLEELLKIEPKLKLVDIKLEEKYHKGKKFAITLGIKASTHEWLLFTDADCSPVTENWIREMSTGMKENKDIVLGYSRYKRQNSILNLFIRWETFYNAMHYFSFALMNKAYMGVGRNLAYRKSLFFKVKGFASHQHILAGEDDLFVNETATPDNVSIVYTRDSFIESQPKLTWGNFWKLKKRNFYTAKFYKANHRRLLSTFTLSHLFFYLFFFSSLIIGYKLWIFSLSIYLLRLIVEGFILFKAMEKLRISKIFSLYWLFDLMMIIYYLTVGLGGVLTKKLKSN